MPSSSFFELGLRPTLGYVDSPLDRAAHRRRDAEALARRDDARAYLLGGELVALKPDDTKAGGHDPLFTMDEARAAGGTEPLFLGLAGEAPRFGLVFPPENRERLEATGLFVSDLRSVAVGGLVAADHLGPFACAKALAGWHQRHRFCSNCGTPTKMIEAGWRRDCPSCGGQHFPRTDPVAIMLTYHGDRCLLGRSPRFAPNMWSCLAGFVEPGETFEDAVRRETLEEAGITSGKVRYLKAQPWPFPMSLMIGCIAEATSTDITIDATELDDARWFDRAEAAQMLTRTHAGGLFVPPPNAIAHHLIRAFVEGETA
ncbi:NADH pyrophosphatase [Azorhizobium oxalatiphilum]|uniref:NAD(+) diphosphatase n=1 Tax=Azorhizobium oxalatiphilum TaxID=980631 RepID=A0A917C9A4_9HYPH|nr:NAD(+) diphosphatase [Azorhizobium oxalatiphilum]GGF76960.1 NADH pyrophosphatase [Azorhizobium oxalatiphilum]